jgi:hypothetical protein
VAIAKCLLHRSSKNPSVKVNVRLRTQRVIYHPVQ